MFKDPFQPDETPYEVLGLEPTASPADVQGSLPRFMRDRKNLPRLAIAQQALRKLKNPADRAQVDIWLYNVEIEPVQAGPELDVPLKIPYCPVGQLYSDATGLDLSKEKREIQFKKMPIDDLPEFDR